jgi:excisionase family DNA binding protein
MYLTVKETADYLSLPVTYINQLIKEKRIRTVFDGDQVLINQEQFNAHLERIEKYKLELEEMRNEPIPEDWDAKDED